MAVTDMADGSFEAMMNKLQSLPIGIMQKKVQVKNRVSSLTTLPDSASAKMNTENDVFDVDFQIAGTDLSWQFFYDRTLGTEQPPDVIFNAASESFVPRPVNMQSLRTWTSSSLPQFLLELFSLFNNFQKSRITNDLQPLYDHWQELLTSSSFGDSCEVYVDRQSSSYTTQVRLIFGLAVDVAILPPHVKIFPVNRDTSYARLRVVYGLSDTHVVELHLSPALRCVLSGNNLRIPSFGDSTLLTYINKVQKLLTNTISRVCESYSRRKQFTKALLAIFPGAILEFNADTFLESTLLLKDVCGFHFILFILLSEMFPADKPKLVIQSVYNLTKNTEPQRVSYTDFEYEVTWTDKHIIESIRTFVRGKAAELRDSMPH